MITRNSILQEIPSLVQQVSQLITSKIAVVPFAVSYGITKNASRAREVETEFYEFRTKTEKKYCPLENGKPKMKLVKAEDGSGREISQLEFKSDEDKKKYTEELNDYLQTEVKFEAYAIKKSDLEAINNVPPHILTVLDKYGIIK